MVAFICDSRGKMKKPEQDWILGLAAENVGAVSGRREVNILSRRAEAQAVNTLLLRTLQGQVPEKGIRLRRSPHDARSLTAYGRLRNTRARSIPAK